jgi:hypothetical protein
MKISSVALRSLIREEAAKLDEAAANAHDSVVDAVAAYQSKGLSLSDLQDAIAASWMAARRASRPARTAAQKAAIAKKSAATRAANKARDEKFSKSWDAWKKDESKKDAALKDYLGPSLWKAFVNARDEHGLSGSKEGGTRTGLLLSLGIDPLEIEEMKRSGIL